MKRKINVAVLMGGKSSEHEISLVSGIQVIKNLSSKKYKILPTVISKDGSKWLSLTPKELFSLPNPIDYKSTNKEVVNIKNSSITTDPNKLKDGSVDIVFIALHGLFGEDGTIQGMLDLADVKYTGSGILASALGMNKIAFRKIMKSEGIDTPKSVEMTKKDKISKVLKFLGNPPYFVKPINQGSSVGMSVVNLKKDLKKALDLAFKYDKTVLIDEYIKGREFTCAILGNKDPEALPVIEIIPKKGEFFDYESKYNSGGSDEIVPAKISKSLSRTIQKISLKVYKAIGCSGFARVDFLLKDNKPVVLEINTIPGLTQMSLFPKAASAAGITYSKLLDKIIDLALKKYKQ